MRENKKKQINSEQDISATEDWIGKHETIRQFQNLQRWL
jgi:hypothetical protein